MKRILSLLALFLALNSTFADAKIRNESLLSRATVGNSGPLDILAAFGTPAVAAHSFTRALSAKYSGHLFKITRASDSTTTFVDPVTPGGIANQATITTFCAATTCSIAAVCDQVSGGCTGSGDNALVQATVANQPILAQYSLANGTIIPLAEGGYNTSLKWLRNRAGTINVPTGTSTPITVYGIYATSVYASCCGGYGDMENPVADTGPGHMFATAYSTGASGQLGTGSGPWVGVDRENGVDLYGTSPPFHMVHAIAKTDCAAGTINVTIKSGDATSGGLTTLFNGPPTFFSYTCHLEGGLSMFEGGDASNTESAMTDGIVVAGFTNNAADNLIQANLVAFYGAAGTPTGSSAVNFVTSQAIPAGWTFIRTACTGGTACATDATYADAPGAPYHTFGTNVPVINSNGLGMFSTRSNFLINSEAPATQTTGSLSTGRSYFLFCNGTGSLTTAAGTITTSGLGTLNCNSGTWQVLTPTVAGTLVVTVSGSVNWFDLQEGFPATSSPTPHIVSGGALTTRAVDRLQIGGAALTAMQSTLATAVIELTPVSKSSLDSGNIDAAYYGGPAGSFVIWAKNSQQLVGIGPSSDSSFTNTTQVVGSKERIGGVKGVGIGIMSLNGVGSWIDRTGPGNQVAVSQTAVQYLGSTASTQNNGTPCNCWISQAAFYPYALGRAALNAKTTLGTPLP